MLNEKLTEGRWFDCWEKRCWMRTILPSIYLFIAKPYIAGPALGDYRNRDDSSACYDGVKRIWLYFLKIISRKTLTMSIRCSIRQMAEYLHMPKSTVHNILQGNSLSLKQAQRLAKALQVTPARLHNVPPEKIRKAILWKMENKDWFDDIVERPAPN